MKYMGSKNRIAKYILPIILKDRKPDQWYIEPFVGGCNMIDKVDGLRWGNDNNEYLIAMWKALQEGWNPPIDITRDDRKYCIDNINKLDRHYVGWVGFGCCYNGVFFGGYAGEIITKTGIKRNYIKEAYRNIKKQLPNLKDVIFTDLHYWNLELPKNSIIYCDPPYKNTAKYKTGDFDHEEFFNWCRKKVEDGHKVFISEYNAPDDFIEIWSKEVTTTLNTSKKDIEKLFVHKSTGMEAGLSG